MAIETNTDTGLEVEAPIEEETIDLPISMLAGKTVAPGDVVKLEVVSSNDDSGTVSVKYFTPKKMGGGIDEAVKAFEA